jgi:hypothetical protein
MTTVPIAEIGLTLPMVLLSIAIWLGIFAGIAIAAAGVGVLIFGPREIDSLILPGMATFGVVVIALVVGRWTMAEAPILLGLAAAAGIGSGAVQRVVGDRLDETSPHWPMFVKAGAIVAGACLGGFFGIVMNAHGGPAFAVAATLVGAIAGWLVGRRRAVPIDETGPEEAPPSSTRPGDW